MATGADWVRLGRMITTRRVMLGMTSVRVLAEATKRISPPGISERTLGKIESGKTRAYPTTLAMLELALRWKAGSAADVLDGGQPREAPGSADDLLTPEEAEAFRQAWPEMPPEMKAAFRGWIRTVREVRERRGQAESA